MRSTRKEQGEPVAAVTLSRGQIEKMFAHARASSPAECCGLVGGRGSSVRKIYPLGNKAVNPLTAYEAAPEDLFRAQREMRERGETLLGIYHSHPREAEPIPSATDVRLAFYPESVYFIVGLGGKEAVLRAFHLYESERRWERVEYRVEDD